VLSIHQSLMANPLFGVLTKPRRERTPLDLEEIARAAKVYPFFAAMDLHQRLEMGRVLQLFAMHEGMPVFHEGDEGDLFYIVLSGKVSIVVGGVTVGSIEAGGQFGELALIKDEPRAATIRTDETTLFATVSKRDYQRTLKQLQKTLLKARVDFLASTSIFRKISRLVLYKWSYYFEPAEVGRNQTLLEQGQQAERVWFIEQGECRVMHRPQTAPRHWVEIAVLGPGDQFGELSAFDRCVQGTAVVTRTPVKLYSILAKDFVSLLPPSKIDEIRNFVLTKEAWYGSRIAQVASARVRMRDSSAAAARAAAKPAATAAAVAAAAATMDAADEKAEEMKSLLARPPSALASSEPLTTPMPSPPPPPPRPHTVIGIHRPQSSRPGSPGKPSPLTNLAAGAAAPQPHQLHSAGVSIAEALTVQQRQQQSSSPPPLRERKPRPSTAFASHQFSRLQQHHHHQKVQSPLSVLTSVLGDGGAFGHGGPPAKHTAKSLATAQAALYRANVRALQRSASPSNMFHKGGEREATGKDGSAEARGGGINAARARRGQSGRAPSDRYAAVKANYSRATAVFDPVRYAIPSFDSRKGFCFTDGWA